MPNSVGPRVAEAVDSTSISWRSSRTRYSTCGHRRHRSCSGPFSGYQSCSHSDHTRGRASLKPCEMSGSGIVLAGGEGKRLMPLTADRAKPAVHFGGSYRSSTSCSLQPGQCRVRAAVCADSVQVPLTRPPHNDHLADVTLLGDYVTPVPAQQRLARAGSPGRPTRSSNP